MYLNTLNCKNNILQYYVDKSLTVTRQLMFCIEPVPIYVIRNYVTHCII